jgi:hypothetical protein
MAIAVNMVNMTWETSKDQHPGYMVQTYHIPTIPNANVQQLIAFTLPTFHHLPLTVANLTRSGIIRVTFFDMFYHFFFVLHNFNV